MRAMVGSWTFYDCRPVKVVGVYKGPYGGPEDSVTLRFESGVEVKTSPGLDPRFGCKTEDEVRERFAAYHKALSGR